MSSALKKEQWEINCFVPESNFKELKILFHALVSRKAKEFSFFTASFLVVGVGFEELSFEIVSSFYSVLTLTTFFLLCVVSFSSGRNNIIRSKAISNPSPMLGAKSISLLAIRPI